MNAAAIETPDTALPGPTIAEFEALDFDVDTFDHAAHVYVAWQYVRERDLLDAIARYRETLIRLTKRIGVPGKYHETITWFFMILVAERVRRDPGDDWGAFRRANPDLFRKKPGIIFDYYARERLETDAARRSFVLPTGPAPAGR
jgi:hypothetical protein